MQKIKFDLKNMQISGCILTKMMKLNIMWFQVIYIIWGATLTYR